MSFFFLSFAFLFLFFWFFFYVALLVVVSMTESGCVLRICTCEKLTCSCSLLQSMTNHKLAVYKELVLRFFFVCT